MFLHFFLVMSRHVNLFCLISLTTFRRFFEKKQASLERISSMQVSKVYVTVHVTNWLPTHIVRKWKWMSKNWASYNSTSQGFKELSQRQNTRNKKNFLSNYRKKNPGSGIQTGSVFAFHFHFRTMWTEKRQNFQMHKEQVFLQTIFSEIW